jgi:hypothetical protein
MDNADQRLESGFEFLPDPIRGQNRTCRLKPDSNLHTVFLTDPKLPEQTLLPKHVFPRPEAFRELIQHLIGDIQRSFHFLRVAHV